MPKNSVPPLTFGVEFEFMVKIILSSSSFLGAPIGSTSNFEAVDPEPEDKRPATWCDATTFRGSVYSKMQGLLRAHGISAVVCGVAGFTDESGDIPFSKWEIKNDISVKLHKDDIVKGYTYIPIEITTPIFNVSNEPNMGMDEIRKVLSLIRNNFRVHVPRSAGLHIHVGNGTSGFTTLHMKNLMSILYVFDKQIQVLHPNRQYGEDPTLQFNSEFYFRAPSRCTLGLYLTGDTDGTYDTLTNTFNLDTKEDLSLEIVENAGKAEYDYPIEFSQAKRFLNKEQKVLRKHVRVRQFFASGPESMSGVGATEIPNDSPGALAQRLFSKKSTGVPVTKLEKGKDLGLQIHDLLTKHLKQDLDADIKNLLLTPGTSILPTTKPYPDPTTLLAPVRLSQTKDMGHLDFISGMGQRCAAYNINGLAALLQNHEEDSLNLYNKRTIEFRQHQGTLDPDRVITWIQMVTGIVEWTRFAPPVALVNLLRIGGEMVPEEFDVVDLLRYMRLSSPADYYEKEFFDKVE